MQHHRLGAATDHLIGEQREILHMVHVAVAHEDVIDLHLFIE
jgi:hypothetical protein